MDNYGKKGHIEEEWILDHTMTDDLTRTDIYRYIVQLNFQLVRTDHLLNLKYKWKKLLKQLFASPSTYVNEIIVVCKLVLYTRDIHFGKGERDLSYMMLLTLYEVNAMMAIMLFDYFVKKLPNKTSIGCWKDSKRMAQYILDETDDKKHNLILYIVEVSNVYLKSDHDRITDIYNLFNEEDADNEKIKQYIKKYEDLTLAAKWLPRKSCNNHKYGWFFTQLAKNMYGDYFKTIYLKNGKVNQKLFKRALNKCEMNYRKMLSFVNKHLNVVEILQCSHKTNEIDFSKIPVKALNQYHRSFMQTHTETHKLCFQNYTKYIDNATHISNHLYLYQIVKKIIEKKLWCFPDNFPEKQLAIKMWNSRKTPIKHMKNIPVIDMSQSMGKVGSYNAIALGVYISEHNTGDFKNNVLLFGNKPRWISLNNMNICEKVREIVKYNHNVNSDLYGVFNMLIDIVKRTELPIDELKPLTVTILSDMQIEDNSKYERVTRLPFYDNIKSIFRAEGISLPQIVFWNLKHSNGFPISVENDDIVMFSGFNENVLTQFKSDDKHSHLHEKEEDNASEKRNILFNILSNKRYDFIDKEVVDILFHD